MPDRTRIPPRSPFEEEIGFTRAVRVGDRILVSGITAVMPDGSAYVSIYPNLYRLNPDGTQYFAQPGFGGGRLCCDKFGTVYTIDDTIVNCVSNGGALAWTKDLGVSAFYGWPGLNDSTLYVLTNDGTMHAFSD